MNFPNLSRTQSHDRALSVRAAAMRRREKSSDLRLGARRGRAAGPLAPTLHHRSRQRRTLGWFLSFVVATVSLLAAGAPGVARLPSGVHRVVFLGDSITYAGGYVADIAAYFRLYNPDTPLEFINVGLSSETVSGLSEPNHADGKFPRPDLHERLTRVLQQTTPDLVIACYGMNDGIYLPLAEDRFARFRAGMEWLHAEVRARGADIVHITPPVYDETKGAAAGYAAVLDRYAAWLVAQRQAAGWTVIDVHTATQQFLAAKRQSSPGFFFARDGVHPDAAGHWVIAREILRHLGADNLLAYADADAFFRSVPHGPAVRKLTVERLALMRDAWLRATGHTRPGVKLGKSLPEARAAAEELDRAIAAELKGK